MSKIVIDARESGTTTGRYVDELIRHLHKIDHNHTIILLARAERLKFLAEIAPNFVVFETPFKEFTFAEQIGLLRQINTCEADLVHFPAAQQPVWYRGKVVTTIQDLTTVRFRNPTKNYVVFTLKRLVYKWVIKRVTKKSVALLTPTQYVKDDVVQFTHVDPAKITVTLEAADIFTEPAKPIPGFEGKRFIMYYGRPLPHKNLRRLIEAFALLSPKQPNLYLMIAGKKSVAHDEFVVQVERLGLGDRVIMTDWISDGQLKWALQHALAHIYPTLSEGFGLPPLEAMMHGTAAITSNVSCMPEVCGDAAAYFDPYDVEDMARVIEQVISDEKLRQELIEKGKQQVKKYSWQRMAEQTLAVYEKSLKS